VADSPLEKSPLGLLEIMRLQTRGKAPDKFGEAVTPTFAVEDYYTADRRFIRRLNGAAAAYPNSIAFNFGPARLVSVCGRNEFIAAGGANAFYYGAVLLRQTESNTEITIADKFFQAPAAGFAINFTLDVALVLPEPIVCPAGSRLTILWQSNDPAVTHRPVMFLMAESLSPL
jgi:hypothetical protein